MRITPPTAQTTSATTMAMATSGFLLDSWHGWLLKSTRGFSNRKYTSSSPPGSFNLPASFPISPHHHHHHHQHHHRQQNLLGEDREGLCRAWRFATWRASSRKAAWYVMTSGSAFFFGLPKQVKFCWKPSPKHAQQQTRHSPIILDTCCRLLRFLSCNSPYSQTCDDSAQVHARLNSVQHSTPNLRTTRKSSMSSRNPASSSNHFLHG